MNMNDIVIGAVALIIIALAIKTIAPFFSPLFFAFITAYALTPIHAKLEKRIGSRNSAIVLTSILLFGALMILVVLIYTLTPVISQAYNYLSNLENLTIEIPFIPSNIFELIKNATDKLIEVGKESLISVTFSVPKYLLQVVVYLAFVYFFLTKMGEAKSLLTFEDEKLMKIISKGNLTLQALVRVWLLLNIAKGILMTLGFLLFRVSDIPTAILAGLLTVLFSFVPLFEGWMIWLIGSLYLIREGHLLTAIGLAVYGFSLVSPLPDFTIRPKLVAREAKFNEVIVLIGMIGGTLGLGLKGLIIGPIVLNVALEMLKEWKRLQSKES
ncbi:hypothetical protein PNA2_1519 [Pyrococcus sp. NA2]|uniref:AI-2E family transporter n=1 Tax=Pyrococcus sp. (strain NA2) TaxID=342949 RepID=UPI000209B070|nr:AI-2E family transporter [Pyrococcus sp. NA2]AEC52435.1 hypothetical protein PNA2_1519 [Pyrococcus sp. NA2]